MIVFVVRILEMHNHKADYIKQVTPFYNVAYLLYPLMDDAQGKFKGGFGVDVLIADLYEQSISLNLGEGAYAFLVDNNGNVVSPDGDAKALSESEGDSVAKKLLSADDSIFLESGVYYTAARVKSTGWLVCLHVPEKLLLAPVHSIDTGTRLVIISFIITFIIILVVVTSVVRRVSHALTYPIISLQEDVLHYTESKNPDMTLKLRKLNGELSRKALRSLA